MPDRSTTRPDNESRRLDILSRLDLDLSDAEGIFAGLAEIAAKNCNAPMGYVGLIGEEGPVFLGTFGAGSGDVELDEEFCRQVISAKAGEATVVPDLTQDERFARTRPAVSGGVRFYAGAPISIEGENIGAVCVFDMQPHSTAENEGQSTLRMLAKTAAALIRTSDSARHSHKAELAWRRAEFRHSLALRAAAISAWMWDIPSNTVTADDTLPNWTQLDASGPMTIEQLLHIVHPDDMESVNVALNLALAEDIDFHSEFRVAGTNRWLMGHGRIYERSSEGRAITMAGVFVDITGTKQSEQTTRMLLRELNHRVKNTLAMLQSLAAQTLRHSSSPEGFMWAFSGRLQALAAAHTMLSDNEWHRVSAHGLLKTLLSPYAMQFDEQVEITGPDALIGPDEGVGLGLVIHELATNAARHGALSVRAGRVKIEIRAPEADGPDVLHFIWQETGGPSVPERRQPGFGSILIERGLQKVIGSKVKVAFAPDGVSADISFPLPEGSIRQTS